jgi:hypothetical protein
MGTVELIESQSKLIISSNVLLYGSLISENLRIEMEDEINTMWNEVNGTVNIEGKTYAVNFAVKCWLFENISPKDIIENRNPKNNYFRIEAYHDQRISFVDGLGSNTGYFLMDNLYKGSTTAAHEYGHTLGLDHPTDMDIRGLGAPGIMYARGTIVDAQYQYNPAGAPGDSSNGGTMHPMHRKVKQHDIDLLQLANLRYENNYAVIGKFTNVYHAMQTQ